MCSVAGYYIQMYGVATSDIMISVGHFDIKAHCPPVRLNAVSAFIMGVFSFFNRLKSLEIIEFATLYGCEAVFLARLCVCLSVTWPKFKLDKTSLTISHVIWATQENVSYLGLYIPVQCLLKSIQISRWAHFNIKLHFFLWSQSPHNGELLIVKIVQCNASYGEARDPTNSCYMLPLVVASWLRRRPTTGRSKVQIPPGPNWHGRLVSHQLVK